MSLGQILVARGLIQAEDLDKALARQKEHGDLLGDNLLALGLVTSERLETVLHELPSAPTSIPETGIAATNLLKLLLKAIYVGNVETASQICEELKLSNVIVNALLEDAVDKRLVEILGASGLSAHSEYRYALTGKGREWAIEALGQCQYVGPAPVSLDDYTEQILKQRITNERIDQDILTRGFPGLTLPDGFMRHIGPAINSGRAILLYGSPGNGKTSVAEAVGKIFEEVVYIPHCIEVDGQIIKIFDPTIHVQATESSQPQAPSLWTERNQELDRRWVPCRRPVIMTGGELTLQMLDLSFDPHTKFYVAPLHVKALGGTFIIDDFGRQLVSPKALLNRWIVPLEKRIDYLTLRTGKTFSVPFDELVIFSTNLTPGDLMDPAFLRRIPYKLEIEGPTREDYETIFKRICDTHELELPDDILAFVLDELHAKENTLVARYQPRFIVEQAIAACRYDGQSPKLTRELVADAWSNLYVHSVNSKATGAQPVGKGGNGASRGQVGPPPGSLSPEAVSLALAQLVQSALHSAPETSHRPAPGNGGGSGEAAEAPLSSTSPALSGSD